MTETGEAVAETGRLPNSQGGKSTLMGLLTQLCNQHGWSSKGRLWTTAIARLLNEVTCEERIMHQLTHPEERDQQRFDPYYAEKSRFGTLKIVDALKTRLLKENYTVAVGTEYRADFGVFDVAIVMGNPIVVMKKGEPALKVEIKGSLGIPLEQVDRYAWTDAPLVLARIITNNVVILHPDEMREFAQFSIESVAAKARRLVDGKPFLVPGPDCRDCGARSCAYYEGGRIQRPIMKMNDAEFGPDLETFFRNLPVVAEKVSDVVVQELRKHSEVPQGAGAE
jgi:hypothetical protein